MTKNFEAVIAGGGLVGGAIALELALAGVRVAVFEQGEPGREASWAAAGNRRTAATSFTSASLAC